MDSPPPLPPLPSHMGGLGVVQCTCAQHVQNLKGAVREIGKLGSNGPFFDADHTDIVHFGLSGFFSGVLVHQSIAPRLLGRSDLV